MHNIHEIYFKLPCFLKAAILILWPLIIISALSGYGKLITKNLFETSPISFTMNFSIGASAILVFFGNILLFNFWNISILIYFIISIGLVIFLITARPFSFILSIKKTYSSMTFLDKV